MSTGQKTLTFLPIMHLAQNLGVDAGAKTESSVARQFYKTSYDKHNESTDHERRSEAVAGFLLPSSLARLYPALSAGAAHSPSHNPSCNRNRRTLPSVERNLGFRCLELDHHIEAVEYQSFDILGNDL